MRSPRRRECPKGALQFHFPGRLFPALVDEFAVELASDAAATIATHEDGGGACRGGRRGSIPPVDTDVAYASLGALDEIMMQSAGELPALAAAAPALSALPLRSVGAADAGAIARR